MIKMKIKITVINKHILYCMQIKNIQQGF